MRIFFAILLGLALALPARAIEFNAQVSVQGGQSITGVDPLLFTELQKAITEYYNTTNFTQYVFEPYERLRVRINIVLTGAPSTSEFTGTFNISLVRPVHGSNYETPLYTFADDDFQIEYTQFQQLQYSENTFVDNLTSILNFHAFMMLGYDFEAMSKGAGAEFFEKARQITNLAQNSNSAGWTALGSTRNRYWLMENMLNNSYKQFHEVYYNYHRQGLDQMTEDLPGARQTILASLEAVRAVYTSNPNVYAIQVFLDTKRNELVNIFTGALAEDKRRFLQIMQQVDPRRIDQYNRINAEEDN